MAITITVEDNIAPSIVKKLNDISKGLGNLEDAADDASDEVDKFDNANKKLTSTLGALQNAVSVAAKAFAAFQVGKYAIAASSSFTELNNKLRTAVGDSREQIDAFRTDIQQMAAEAGTSVDALVAAFQRFSPALANFGKSAQDTLKFTNTLSKGMALIGATNQEVEGTIIQLSQAFNMGALRGQEFMALATNYPQLLQEIANEMGVTRGELQELAGQGKITGDIIYDTVLKMSDSIENDFGKATLTLEQGFIVLKDAVTLFVGELLEAMGFSGTFGDALAAIGEAVRSAAKAMQIIAPILKAVVASFVALKVQAALAAASTAAAGVAAAASAAGVGVLTIAVNVLNTALRANWIGLFAAGLVLAWEAGQAFGEWLGIVGDDEKEMREELRKTNEELARQQAETAKATENWEKYAKQAERIKALGGSDFDLTIANRELLAGATAVLEVYNDIVEEERKLAYFNKLPEAVQKATKARDEYLQKANQALASEKLSAEALAEAQKQAEKLANDRYREVLIQEQILQNEKEALAFQEKQKKSAEEYNKLLLSRSKALADISRKLDETAAKLYLTSGGKSMFDFARDAERAAIQDGQLELTDSIRLQLDLLKQRHAQILQEQRDITNFSTLVQRQIEAAEAAEKQRLQLRKENLEALKQADILENKALENHKAFLAVSIAITKEQKARADLQAFLTSQIANGREYSQFEQADLLAQKMASDQLLQDAQIAATLQIEIERNKFDAIDNLRKQGYLSEVQYARAARTLRQQEAQQTLSQFADLFGQVAALGAQGSAEMFAIAKAGAIAQATINTILGASKALAEGGFFLGPIFAATMTAIGAAQVAQIAAQSYTPPTVTRAAGFKQGGYTGDISPGEVAGVVHGREFVFDAQSTARIGVENLENMRKGNITNNTQSAESLNVAVVNSDKAALAALSSAAGKKIIIDAVANNSAILRKYL